MKKIIFLLIILGFVVLMNNDLNATTIFYDVSNLGGSRWEYAYSVSNDTLTSAIEEFTIFFDYGLYDNLSGSTSPADWDTLSVNPQQILGVPQDGFYDALALVTGIAPGSTLNGFSVSFDWLGTGIPSSQYFEIVDPVTFVAFDSGQTSAVPEPGTLMLLGSGLIVFAGLRRRIKKRENSEKSLPC